MCPGLLRLRPLVYLALERSPTYIIYTDPRGIPPPSTCSARVRSHIILHIPTQLGINHFPQSSPYTPFSRYSSAISLLSQEIRPSLSLLPPFTPPADVLLRHVPAQPGTGGTSFSDTCSARKQTIYFSYFHHLHHHTEVLLRHLPAQPGLDHLPAQSGLCHLSSGMFYGFLRSRPLDYLGPGILTLSFHHLTCLVLRFHLPAQSGTGAI